MIKLKPTDVRTRIFEIIKILFFGKTGRGRESLVFHGL